MTRWILALSLLALATNAAERLKAYRKGFGAWSVFDVSKDFGEANNVAKDQEAFIQSRAADGAAWGKTHRSPEWHDTQASLDSWNNNKMPHYDKTFSVR